MKRETCNVKQTTIAELLKHAGEIDSDTPLLDAQVLLGHVLGRSRTYLYTWPERIVAVEHEQAFLRLMERRKQGEPIAYLAGRQEFWSLSLAVSPDTLIPRPETELLVEKALELDLPDGARVLDLGTGTGAIALALASERPAWSVVAVDSQPGAIDLAKTNAASFKLDRVRVFRSHWFEAVTGSFDLIVSNPPYVAADDPHLDRGDVRFEPRSALVAGDAGLDDITAIVRQAADYLNLGGWLMVEHGVAQEAAVQRLFAEQGFARVTTFTDLAGLPRVTAGCR